MIKIRELKTAYSYGDPFCVSSLSFEKGKITSIIGRNGCGKTTLLKTIAGFLPYQGSLLIDDKECRDYQTRERGRRIAYLPQMIKAVSMDVGTLVEHGRYPWHGNYRKMTVHDKEQVEEALDITGMSIYRGRDLTELSGGQLRRAYLSMVIAQNADMILLDEPTTYMDIETQGLFYEIAKKLAAKGHGVIMTCHNIEQGFSYSDNIVVMGDRCVTCTGSPEEIVKDTEELRNVFGAAIKPTDDREMLYPYILIR